MRETYCLQCKRNTLIFFSWGESVQSDAANCGTFCIWDSQVRENNMERMHLILVCITFSQSIQFRTLTLQSLRESHIKDKKLLSNGETADKMMPLTWGKLVEKTEDPWHKYDTWTSTKKSHNHNLQFLLWNVIDYGSTASLTVLSSGSPKTI
ncbi:hypothetical protein SAY86_008979 [Trapa natans]|uniref:Uncharacterized protein n=1 Tax=Trapa natans TaxID=22666 RepID=A0AAN7KAG3_TRANT|nr:hypothetical protein SAY86_008979 [Trapa natans]